MADSKILVDCGLFQGYKQLRLRNWATLPVAPREIAAVVLTHAHLDHNAYLPVLVKNGFCGNIYCSEATRDLCRILLPDSGHLQEEEAEYANRRGFSKHKPALPLYTVADAEHALTRFTSIAFEHHVGLPGDMNLRLRPAGICWAVLWSSFAPRARQSSSPAISAGRTIRSTRRIYPQRPAAMTTPIRAGTEP